MAIRPRLRRRRDNGRRRRTVGQRRGGRGHRARRAAARGRAGLGGESAKSSSPDPEKAEKNCRICHLGLESAAAEAGAGITLGCSCKGDLSYSHKQCAETWFKIRGNKSGDISHYKSVCSDGTVGGRSLSNPLRGILARSVQHSSTFPPYSYNVAVIQGIIALNAYRVKLATTCEICSSTACNVVVLGDPEFVEQSNESNTTAAGHAFPNESRRFWQGHRFLNFLLACMVFAFVISWLFHFNVPG
ncbi:hypothetical protein TRIUR3_23118 [Triticum urartu]|uniref:Uncharacterized protein n=1 Tax=Triticum urartu TaxID=4572 RepID=M8AIL2_TRIUA|nr:hypothetical protein TRIUR3_23118 [Triticum urartu]